MNSVWRAFILGCVVGALATAVAGILLHARLPAFWNGSQLGIGIGLGGIFGLGILNYLVTNLDRLKSNKL